MQTLMKIKVSLPPASRDGRRSGGNAAQARSADEAMKASLGGDQ
jgi:hypothetical protein